MIKRVLSIVTVFMVVGCGKYVEPKLNDDSSFLVLKDKKDVKRASYIYAKIDNQSIDTYNGLITKVRMTPGKHTINLDSTIYYGAIAKRAKPENFVLEFKSRNVYTIELIPQTTNLRNDDDNMTGTYKIFENKKLILKKDLIFTNRILESTNNNSSGMDPMVIDSIIYSAMLTAGI